MLARYLGLLVDHEAHTDPILDDSQIALTGNSANTGPLFWDQGKNVLKRDSDNLGVAAEKAMFRWELRMWVLCFYGDYTVYLVLYGFVILFCWRD